MRTQKPGADEKREREGELTDDDQLANPQPCGRAGDAPAFAQAGCGLGVGDPQRRQQAEDEADCHGQPDDEAERAEVERRRQRDGGVGDEIQQPSAEQNAS